MRNLFFLGMAFMVSDTAMAQESVLPKDENGKFIYYEVVQNQSSLPMLQTRAKTYFKSVKNPKLKSVLNDTVFVAMGKIVINKTVLAMGHPSGEVLYQLNIELKKEKYHFWLTDFMFIPYQRDRYGNFVPSTTMGKHLEDEPGKLNTLEWKGYQLQTAQHCKAFAQNLKLALANAVAEPIKKVAQPVKKEW